MWDLVRLILDTWRDSEVPGGGHAKLSGNMHLTPCRHSMTRVQVKPWENTRTINGHETHENTTKKHNIAIWYGILNAYIRFSNDLRWFRQCFWINGRIRLSVSTVNRTYELSGITHVTPFRKYGKQSTGLVLTDRESVPTASCSAVSPFLRFVVTEPSRMKSVRTEGCHAVLFREFVGTACCTYGQSNTTIHLYPSHVVKCVSSMNH